MAPTLAAAGDDAPSRIDAFLRGRCQDDASTQPPAPPEGPASPRRPLPTPRPPPTPAGVATLLSSPRRGPGYRDLTIAPGTLGLTLDLVHGRGGVVTAVHPFCAFGDELRVGDVLASVDGRRIGRVEDLHAGEERPRVFRVVEGKGGPTLPAAAVAGGRPRTGGARAARAAARRASQDKRTEQSAAASKAAAAARKVRKEGRLSGGGTGKDVAFSLLRSERATLKAGQHRKGNKDSGRNAARKARAAGNKGRRATVASVATQTLDAGWEAPSKRRAGVPVATQTVWHGQDCAPGALPPGAAHVCGPYAAPPGPGEPAGATPAAAPRLGDPAGALTPPLTPGHPRAKDACVSAPGADWHCPLGGDRCHLPTALRSLPLPAKPYRSGHEYFPPGRRLGVKRALLSAYDLHVGAQELEALLAGPAAPTSALARGAVREAARVQAAQRDAILGVDVGTLAWFEGVLLRLVRFKVDHKHLDITEATGGTSLNSKVQNLRTKRANGASQPKRKTHEVFFAENVPLLTEFGFLWTCPRTCRRTDWDDMFQLLVAYKEEHGHCNVPQLYKTPSAGDDDGGAGLGAWVSNNRKAYEYQATADERELDDKIQAMLESRKIAPRETALKRKRRHGNLTPDQIAKLDALGFVWKLRHGRPKKGRR